MQSLVIAGIVFLCAFGGALIGMSLRRFIPEAHLSPDAKEVVRLATGLLATLAALVLGLLVASAKSSFDAQATGFQEMAADVLVLDRILARYGPQALPAREALARTVDATIDHLWPAAGSPKSGFDDPEITKYGQAFYAAIQDITAKSGTQSNLQAEALQAGNKLARARWLLSQQQDSSSSLPFLIVLVFWLSVIFASFGMFSPRNGTVMTVFVICALSAAGAVFLIVDLNQPSDGLIHISSAPLRYAAAQLGK